MTEQQANNIIGLLEEIAIELKRQGQAFVDTGIYSGFVVNTKVNK